MSDRSLVRKGSSKLLKTLLDNPALPAYVAQLAPPTLNKLVAHIGPEDSGSLIAYATDKQLRSLLDEALWSNLEPGQLEQLRPEEFVRWLYIFQEQGEAGFAERIVGLGLDYAVLNFGQLVRVNTGETIRTFDYEVIERGSGRDGYAEEIEGSYVTAVFDEEWDITRAALIALQDFSPEFLRRLLLRLNLGHADYLLHDVAGERRDSKESAGFVTPESATAFFELTRSSTLEDLTFGANLDPISVRYFSQLGEFEASEIDKGGDDTDAMDEILGETADADGGEPVASSAEYSDLEALLVEAEVIASGPTLLLAGPEETTEMALKIELDRLQWVEPHLFSTRLAELVYLSNLLIAGETVGGKRFDQSEAARATLATCNFGWSYLRDEESIEDALSEGLVRLFRIGWKLLHGIPEQVARELAATLRSSAFAEKMYDKQWVLAELDTTLEELINEVVAHRYGEAKTSLTFISLVLEENETEALLAVVADYPRFSLEAELRYFQDVEDVTQLAGFVRALSR
ncbi:MAG: hypothetical protein GKR90_09760 [Pseudomonadales bacterium]|nr:hypothetical protein [Pseudomonadales bacterium]